MAKEEDRGWRSAARRMMRGHGHEKRLKGGGDRPGTVVGGTIIYYLLR